MKSMGKYAAMQKQTVCGIAAGSLMLNGSLRCKKEARTRDMILDKCKIQHIFLCFK